MVSTSADLMGVTCSMRVHTSKPIRVTTLLLASAPLVMSGDRLVASPSARGLAKRT